ncbi:hypothetical protein [Nocardia barduliensis]|uniref:hypothetical protein n=1 Tax=Nocardia barduliensis TaxID=2736643 RepID=UPI001573D9CF|nr:hypothetical protein [Nocardia barduliensis]
MSEPSNREVTLAIRIDTARHTQLSWIAELRGSSLKAECFRAVDAHIEAAKNDPDLMARANAARAAIEEEARARQAAIENLFTETPPPPPDDQADTERPTVTAEEVTVGEAEAPESEPTQGNRRARGRRGGQHVDGEPTDS